MLLGMSKDFDKWNSIKKKLDQAKRLPTFKEREIWWCSIGVNIGYEIFGKGQKFWRPVLILDKHNRYTFFGLPLSSTVKQDNPYYYPFPFRGRKGSILFSQGRTFSSLRLSNQMGKVTPKQFAKIKTAFKNTI